jgi:hypothetical protein
VADSVVNWEIQTRAPVSEIAGPGSLPVAARPAMLADPIIRALMEADRVDPQWVEAPMRRMARVLPPR